MIYIETLVRTLPTRIEACRNHRRSGVRYSALLCSALSCPVTREIVAKNQDEGGCLWGGPWAFRKGWRLWSYYDKISFL